MAVVRRLLIIAAICAVLCKIYVTALKIKIYVKLSSLSLQKRLLKQKWLFRCNLIFLFVQGAKRWKQRRAVVLFRLFCCTKQTFVFLTWAFSGNKAKHNRHSNCLHKNKVAFSLQFDFLFVQGAKRWKRRRAVVLFRLFCCTKQTFASFNVGVFRQQGETQLTLQTLTKAKWLFRCNLIFLFVQGAKRWKQRRAVVLFRLFCCTKQTFVFLTWAFSGNKAKMSNLLILQHFFTLFALFNKQWYNYL